MPSIRSTDPALMRGSPTQLPVAVRRRLSRGMSSLRMVRGAEASVTGSSRTTCDGALPIGVNAALTLMFSAIRSQSQPTLTVKLVLSCAIQTNALTEAISPTLVRRGVNSMSERP